MLNFDRRARFLGVEVSNGEDWNLPCRLVEIPDSAPDMVDSSEAETPFDPERLTGLTQELFRRRLAENILHDQQYPNIGHVRRA